MVSWLAACALLTWLCVGNSSSGAAPLSNNNITQDELVRRTQEMFDAVAGGNKGPWSRNFADDAIYFDERGRSMDKPALLSDLTPLSKGYAGKITVTHVISRIQPQVAVLSYDLDEIEVVFGQKLHARYHGTDTWLLRNGAWQIVAGPMFRYYEDPAEGVVTLAKFRDYCGAYALAPGVTRNVKMRRESTPAKERRASGRATPARITGFVFPSRDRRKDLISPGQSREG